MPNRPALTKIANCYSPTLASEQPGSGRTIEIVRDNTNASGRNRWIATQLRRGTVERTTYHPELLAALDLASALGYTDAIAASEVATHALAAACSAREGLITERECASLVTSLLSVAEIATNITASPYVWLVCNDLSPRRATVIQICETGPEARALEGKSLGLLLVQPALRHEGVAVGDRIWRGV